MNHLSERSIHYSAVLFLCALVAAGCSSSSDLPSSGQVNVENAEGNNSLDENLNSEPGEDLAGNTEVPNQEAQNRIQVNFEITVPAYQSNALQVRLNWGESNLTASWVGDEYWSASADLPTNTENTLSVIFYDDNGEIELASFSTLYRTGINAAETIQISASQFDSDQWDTDGDGVSNLDELLAGADPSVDEDSLLEIRDYHTIDNWSRMSVSENFESRIPNSRPVSSSFEPEPPYSSFAGSLFGSIDIDINGNGTLDYGHYWPIDQLRFTGTRTHTESSISWEGTRSAYDGDYRHGVSVTSSVKMIDENTRDYVEELSGNNVGAYTFTWEIKSNINGKLVAGTSVCMPASGTFSSTHRTSPGGVVAITGSKEIDDRYWKLTRVENDTITTEYFVRDLIMYLRSGAEPSSATAEEKYFICEFVDF